MDDRFSGPADILDLCGLHCPLPAIKTRRKLGMLSAGARIEVRCTDALAAIDIPHLVRETGDLLVDHRKDGRVLVFLIEKANRDD